jgi:hypothetical protein
LPFRLSCAQTRLLLPLLFVWPSLLFAGESSYIPSRDYGATLIREINAAQRSISVYCYLFALYPNRTASQTMQIAAALGAARKRGVSVEVVLDNGAYSNGDPIEAMQEDNRSAYEYLSGQGIDVFFDDAAATLHAKAIVIDSVTAIVGSANLSEAALNNNIEVSLLVRNRETSKALLAELGKIPRKRRPAADSATALVPVAFLTDTTLLGRMVSRGDERAFDVYLYLRKEVYGGPPGCVIDLDYARLASSLGIDSMAPNDFRRQITKTLEKIREYNLARVTTRFGKNAEVSLIDLPGPVTAIPSGYWIYGWQKRLSFAAKVLSVLGSHYSGISPMRPRWSMAAVTLASRHGMSIWFVQTGTVDLRRANLLDVEYDELLEKPDHRRPNIYTPLAFYDPKQLDSKWSGLESRFGKEVTGRARDYAALVYKDSDWRAVEQFISLEQRYGREKVEAAAEIIKAKSPDNPRRTVGYFIMTVKKLKEP